MRPALTFLILSLSGLGQSYFSGKVSISGTTGSSSPLLIQLSGDGRYLVSQQGTPFFINGDTAWSAIVQLSLDEMDTYLSDRSAKGYNTVLVQLIENEFGDNSPSTYDGIAPFTGSAFTTPREAYFARADAFISKAASNNIIVMLAPLYLGYLCGSQGWCPEVQSASVATMRAWGQYVGNRYKNYPNIIWIIGGDTDPGDYSGVAEKTEAVALGIRDVDTAHVITAHNGPETDARDEWTSQSWLTLNNLYSYNDADTMHSRAIVEYAKTPFMPIFMAESNYENEHGATAFTLRRTTWHAVTYGATAGHLFGNCPIWHFNAPAAAGFCSAGTWQSNLNSTPSQQLAYVGKLMRSRRHHLMQPDTTNTVLTAGLGSGSTLATCSLASDRSTAIAYIPTQRAVTIDMTEFEGSGTVSCWWYNPRTGVASLIGQYAGSGTQNFTPPDTNDWVLVCDADSQGFTSPGT